MQESIESASKLVVAGGEVAELLEPIEESLDKVSCLVAHLVIVARGEPVAAWRDDCLRTHGMDGVDESVAVDGLGGERFHQGRPLCDVGHLAAGQNQPQGIVQGIHASVNLGGQSAPRSTDRLIATVFLGAPVECWWVRTTVKSMNSSSRSASPWSASANIRRSMADIQILEYKHKSATVNRP